MKQFEYDDLKSDKATITCSKKCFAIGAVLNALIILAVGLGVYYGARNNSGKLSECKTTSFVPTVQATTAIIPSTAAPPVINYRLPTALYPTTYRLHLKTYLPSPGNTVYDSAKNFTFDGYMEMDFSANQRTRNVSLNMNELDHIECNLTHNGGIDAVISLDHMLYDNLTQILTFPLPTLAPDLMPERNYTLKCSYVGYLNNELAGFYRSSYVEDGVTKWLAITQFESVDARRALPCFDEPAYKAVFELTITHPASMVALSNGMEYEPQDLGNGWKMTSFKPTPKMSTYLLAMSVCDFRNVSAYADTAKKTLFRIWARPSFIEQANFAALAGPKVLSYYEREYFNITFPLEKQDMMAIPDFEAGAMENWGLVTYREAAILYSNESGSPFSASYLEGVVVDIAHELSHQWFGDLVTMEWWNDIWLNEGFASYMQYIGSDVIMDGQYHMGGAILKMLNHTLNGGLFVAGIRYYLNQHAFANAEHTNLWTALTKVISESSQPILDWNGKPLNVSNFMNTWVLQMGFPLITAQFDGRVATLTQNRFLLNDSAPVNPTYPSSPYNYQWYVPIWYQCGADTNVSFAWLEPNKTLTVNCTKSRWILINPEVRGYYRVTYDTSTWAALKTQLLTDHTTIDVKNRAQIMDDVFNLARAGKLNYSTAFEFTTYLKNETNYLPWASALGALGYIDLMLQNSDAYQYFQTYVLNLIQSTYNRMTWDNYLEPVTNVHAHQLRRAILQLACAFGMKDCIDNSQKLFQEYQQSKNTSATNPISAGLRNVVYCTGVMHGEYSDWNFLWQQYLNETNSAERNSLLYGLACTTQPWILTKLLNEGIFVGSIRRQDVRYLFQYLTNNPVANIMMWDYLNKNWDHIQSSFGGQAFGFPAIIQSVASTFNTAYQTELLTEFMQQHQSQLGSAIFAAEQQLETAMSNQAWMDRYAASITAWLQQAIA